MQQSKKTQSASIIDCVLRPGQQVLTAQENIVVVTESTFDQTVLTGSLKPLFDICSQSGAVKNYESLSQQFTEKEPYQVAQLNKDSGRNFQYVMIMRWLKDCTSLPSIDQTDISVEVPHLNGGRVLPIKERNQPDAEFSQTAYLRIRHQEESYRWVNYLDPQKSPEFAKILQTYDKSQLKQVPTVNDRAYAVQKIFTLHEAKEYQIETLFTAVAIYDRYLAAIGHWNYPRRQICHLATVSLLLAAKLEQPISPSFRMMIQHLTAEEKLSVNKADLIELEACIIAKLGFDFNYPGPYQSLERYLRLLGYQNCLLVKQMATQICKFQLNDPTFIGYRPSQLAACAIVIAINIYKRDEMKNDRHEERVNQVAFFKSTPDGKLLLINSELWDAEVAAVSGYAADDLSEALYALCHFIRNSLTPDRLHGFDLESILVSASE